MNLTKLEALAKAATPGPWKFNGQNQVSAKSQICKTWNFGGGMGQTNGNLIAAANPETILALVALVREMGEALEEINLRYCEETPAGIVIGNALAKFKEVCGE